MHPVTVCSGKEALATLGSLSDNVNPIRIVLMDVHMPDMDGFETTRLIKQDPELDNIDVLILSSADCVNPMQRCREVGASDYLLKPIKQSELLEAISRLLRGKTAESAIAPTTPVGQGSVGRESLSILVVEDNAVNQTLMREILTKQGHRVTAAENGQEAIELVIQHPFDVILMDLQMPVMGGIESTQRIRQWEHQL